MFVAAERLVEALQGIAQHSTAQHTGPTDDTKTRWFWGLGWTDWDALGSGAPLHDPHHWAGLTQGNRAPVPSIGTVTYQQKPVQEAVLVSHASATPAKPTPLEPILRLS
ncbi:hypothetical protein CEP52_006944 [Fusarium oligoseptatum]|uniref:Uncharacterized protein n=1 Tax=Fusarium oligoseptatum TaxID=2604345 RepID=A0A428TQC0_9HYPO|nr:hypothetical protein CEP52_006944 [Fusarium oligoseptatum]